MHDVDQYTPGTPSWVDVTAKDTDASAAFYGALFGWEASDPGTDEETGGYRMFSMRGRPEPAFYAAVFGWTADTQTMGDTPYTTWKLGEKPVGGMIQMTDEGPAGMPSHSMAYFAVADTDAACAQAAELGATVHVPARDVEGVGRFAVLGDPQGAPFAIIAMS